MPQEQTCGGQTTQRRKQSSCYVGVTLKPRVYERLLAMQKALQAEVGDAIDISMATIVRRLLYQHPALRNVARRHYTPPLEKDDEL